MMVGYNWSEWSAMTVNGVDVTSSGIVDEATITTDEVSAEDLSSCEVGSAWTELHTGACDGNVYIYVLRECGSGVFQTIDDSPSLGCVLDPEQDTTRINGFMVDCKEVGRFKVLVDNDSGQLGNLSLKLRQSNVG